MNLNPISQSGKWGSSFSVISKIQKIGTRKVLDN